jgi:hypothetical protein
MSPSNARKVGGKELVAAGDEFRVGPPAVLDEVGFLICAVPWAYGRFRVGDAGEVDALTSMMLAAPVVEPRPAVPQVAADARKQDAGFFGEFAAGGFGQGFDVGNLTITELISEFGLRRDVVEPAG